MDASPQILVVVDHRRIREPFVRYLKRHEVRVTVAESAPIARRALRTSAVDPVIFDIMLVVVAVEAAALDQSPRLRPTEAVEVRQPRPKHSGWRWWRRRRAKICNCQVHFLRSGGRGVGTHAPFGGVGSESTGGVAYAVWVVTRARETTMAMTDLSGWQANGMSCRHSVPDALRRRQTRPANHAASRPSCLGSAALNHHFQITRRSAPASSKRPWRPHRQTRSAYRIR